MNTSPTVTSPAIFGVSCNTLSRLWLRDLLTAFCYSLSRREAASCYDADLHPSNPWARSVRIGSHK